MTQPHEMHRKSRRKIS